MKERSSVERAAELEAKFQANYPSPVMDYEEYLSIITVEQASEENRSGVFESLYNRQCSSPVSKISHEYSWYRSLALGG
jgi:hypothetical protein